MKNGNGHREFDPTDGMEVTDILPTATGQYLEEVRRWTQAHIRLMNATIFKLETLEQEEDMMEIISGSQPYRDIRYVPRDPMYPHHSWFWKE